MPTLPRLSLALIPLALLAGCSNAQRSTLPYTDALAQEWQLNAAHRQQLQYYLSDQVSLQRGAQAYRHGINDGRLQVDGAARAQEIVIEPGTPGVAEASGPGWLAVSFEPGSYLYFTREVRKDEEPRYYLHIPPGHGRTVRLGGEAYQVSQESMDAYLLVERDQTNAQQIQSRELPGRTLR